MTCRTKPYEQDSAWQLRDVGTMRRLEPFTLGQVRHFVRAWYREASSSPDAKYTLSEAEERAELLIDAVAGQAKLQEIAASPLLLTMLTLLHYNRKNLPQERADVYEALVKLLLERWEGVRSTDRDRREETIGERLGLPRLTPDDLRPAIHEIAFEAHRQAVDGRGVVPEKILRKILDPFFAHKIDPLRPDRVQRSDYAQKTDTFIEVLCEETGLIQAEDDQTYVLPHLTFQEYLAACYLAAREDDSFIYEQWVEGGDRWREPLLLLMRRLLNQEKRTLAFGWLIRLIERNCGTAEKLPDQRQRDAILAAACYTELGRSDYLAESGRDVINFEDRLSDALVEILEHPAPTILVTQRIEAGDALSSLGDPRFPVMLDAWRTKLTGRNECFGQPAGYWCYVRPGTYRIGGWEKGEKGAKLTLREFWIARFPVTVAQFAPFVDVGYGVDADRWWTPNGWQWKQDQGRRQPGPWQTAPFDGANQPVIGVAWYETMAYCGWLTQHLADVLPPGYIVRLPTEAEWEVAAAYDLELQRHTYPWGDAPPTTEHAVYKSEQGPNVGRPAPVGCCAAGAAACGALDLAGNILEWMSSHYRKYPQQSNIAQEDFIAASNYDVPLRGGAWQDSDANVHCKERRCGSPGGGANEYGFRIVVAPRLA